MRKTTLFIVVIFSCLLFLTSCTPENENLKSGAFLIDPLYPLGTKIYETEYDTMGSYAHFEQENAGTIAGVSFEAQYYFSDTINLDEITFIAEPVDSEQSETVLKYLLDFYGTPSETDGDGRVLWEGSNYDVIFRPDLAGQAIGIRLAMKQPIS